MNNLYDFFDRSLTQIRQLPQTITQSLRAIYRQRFRRIGLALLTCTIAFSLISCIAEPQSPLRIGYLIWPGYESLYLARDLGYYNEKSVRLVDHPSANEVIRSFRNHDLDIATLTMYEALLVAETNPQAKIVLVMDSSHGADVVLGQPEIKDIKDIQDKRIGVDSGALGAFMFTRAFEQASLDPKDAKVVVLGVSEHEAAFKNRNVDAIVTFEPTRSKLLATGANQLFDSSKIPGEILDVLVVHDEVIKNRSDLLQKIIDGHFKALKYMQENPEDAANRIAPREGVTPAQFLESLKGIRIPSIRENIAILERKDTASQQRVQRVSEFMKQKNLLRSPTSLSSLFDDQFVKRTAD
ncbi:ABC transporter substrate-binding protein [filamentous cyanobacterium LEGE 11480]|uniref:ABC transporter substrate-binding protein n=1 Tax=Romeriopsis navalis LEGE 11480 TaxID=2777977 RepID=A0A928VSM2_9CYAN|nr:ABC transporter substrate-binding protein [Romeriopsis navalis]MBE9032261.1 ABC transporter substrate-binding protein [Romeriopsis navalis LEGE 11480]